MPGGGCFFDIRRNQKSAEVYKCESDAQVKWLVYLSNAPSLEYTGDSSGFIPLLPFNAPKQVL